MSVLGFEGCGVVKSSPKHFPKDSTPTAATQEADEVTRAGALEGFRVRVSSVFIRHRNYQSNLGA